MNRLLKFKDFSDLYESITVINEGKVVPKNYLESYYKNVSDKAPINTKKNELIRASFGLDSLNDHDVSDEVKNNITKMFTGVGESVIKITKFLPGENRVERSHGSGDMPTYLVITDKNSEGYLITNNSVSTKVKVEGVEKLFRPKELTPVGLKIERGPHTSKSSLIEIIKGSLGYITDELHKNFMLKLLDVCGNPEKYGFKVDKKDSIDNVLGEYTINCELDDFEKIKDLGNFGNIQNDFGELLGSVFVFNLLKPEAIGAGVMYPGPNEKLLDFSFNGKDISSKGGKGAAATITEYIKRIEDKEKTGEWLLTPEQIDVKDRILKPLSLGEDSKENKPFKWFGKSSKGSSIFSSTIILFNRINLNGWATFKNEFGIRNSDDINRDDIIDAYDRLGRKGMIFHALGNYRKTVKFDPESDNEYFLGIINAKNRKESKKSWEDLIGLPEENPKRQAAMTLLIGAALYPCSNEVTDYVYREKAKNGETYMKIINDMINHAVSVNQLNLTIDIKRDSINFGMYASEKSTYKMQGLNNFGSPLNSNFKIKRVG
jgi:hypothetical protein